MSIGLSRVGNMLNVCLRVLLCIVIGREMRSWSRAKSPSSPWWGGSAYRKLGGPRGSRVNYRDLGFGVQQGGHEAVQDGHVWTGRIYILHGGDLGLGFGFGDRCRGCVSWLWMAVFS